jgi:glycosyltransferase involved in cell wall biosynthesis
MKLKIEITIPVLNEAKSLAQQIRKIHLFICEYLQDIGQIKIIIADNGSTDRTPDEAKKLTKKLNGVEIEYIRIEQRGVGRALKNSWSRSNADIVGYMDLDLATDLIYIRPALELLATKKFEIITGSRLLENSRVIGRKPLRNFASLSLNYLLNKIFDSSFSDAMCGFKFINRRILPSLIRNGARSDGWFFAAEILLVADFLKYRIYDMPIKWTDDVNSKVKTIKLSIEYLRAIFILKCFFNKLNIKK